MDGSLPIAVAKDTFSLQKWVWNGYVNTASLPSCC